MMAPSLWGDTTLSNYTLPINYLTEELIHGRQSHTVQTILI